MLLSIVFFIIDFFGEFPGVYPPDLKNEYMNPTVYFFSHDINAKDDPKCMLMIDQLGPEAYGIFWILVEILGSQPEYKYPIELVPIIARRYNTTKEKMLAVISKYQLFEVDEDNNFFSLSLNRRMGKIAEIKEKRRRAGIASGEKRRQKALNISSTHDEHMMNTCSTHVEQNRTNKTKENKTKENKTKENNKKENVSKKSKRKNFSAEIKDFTALLSKKFNKNITNHLSPSQKWEWVDTIDKLIRLDNFSKTEIEQAVDAALKDEFWFKNFQSLTKLRRKNKDNVKYIQVFLTLNSAKKQGLTQSEIEQMAKEIE